LSVFYNTLAWYREDNLNNSSGFNDSKNEPPKVDIKYNPKADKKSAEAMASANLKEFLKDIEACLKNK